MNSGFSRQVRNQLSSSQQYSSNANNNSSFISVKNVIPVDFRCEYDLPKFCDLNSLDECIDDRFSTLTSQRLTNGQQQRIFGSSKGGLNNSIAYGAKSPNFQISDDNHCNDQFYSWFQEHHDFKISKDSVHCLLHQQQQQQSNGLLRSNKTFASGQHSQILQNNSGINQNSAIYTNQSQQNQQQSSALGQVKPGSVQKGQIFKQSTTLNNKKRKFDEAINNPLIFSSMNDLSASQLQNLSNGTKIVVSGNGLSIQQVVKKLKLNSDVQQQQKEADEQQLIILQNINGKSNSSTQNILQQPLIQQIIQQKSQAQIKDPIQQQHQIQKVTFLPSDESNQIQKIQKVQSQQLFAITDQQQPPRKQLQLNNKVNYIEKNKQRVREISEHAAKKLKPKQFLGQVTLNNYSGSSLEISNMLETSIIENTQLAKQQTFNQDLLKKIRPKTVHSSTIINAPFSNKENSQGLQNNSLMNIKALQNIKPHLLNNQQSSQLTENFNHLNISNHNKLFNTSTNTAALYCSNNKAKEITSQDVAMHQQPQSSKSRAFLYEPPKCSQRQIRQWEQQTGKAWYNLSPLSRVKANQEIETLKSSQITRSMTQANITMHNKMGVFAHK